MKYCHNCGTKLEDSMEFCPNCGTMQLKLNRQAQTVEFSESPASSAPAAEPAPAEPAQAVEAPEAVPEFNPGFSGSFETPAASGLAAAESTGGSWQPEGYERPKAPAPLEYGKAPSYASGSGSWSEGSTPAKRKVKMPELGKAGSPWQPGGSFGQPEAAAEQPDTAAQSFGQPGNTPAFQGRPIHGAAASSGSVPAGTEGSFSAGYGRGTTQSYSQSPVPPAPPAKKRRTGLIIALVAIIVIAAVSIVGITIGLSVSNHLGGGSSTGSSDQVIYDDCKVQIGDGYVIKDFAGENAIAVEVTWTNLGDQLEFPGDLIEVKAFQNGKELLMTFPADGDDFYDQTDLYYESVAPGDSVTFVACFELEGKNHPVDVEVSRFSGDKSTATCTFTIN